MRLGINGTGLVQKASVDVIAADVARAAAGGYSSYWLAEHPTGGFDALTALAIAGQRVPGIELGTAIVPTSPRHPMVLAGQAATVDAAIGGRLTLGVGLSHAPMMERLGLDFEKPIRRLREYLSILVPLLTEGKVSFRGQLYSCESQLFRAPARRVPVVVAALGPQALAVAGALTDGVTLAWSGPRTVREHIVPLVSEAAAANGRSSPRIIATLPVCVTDEAASVRALVAKTLSMYGELPAYRAMFEREGVEGPAGLAIVGDEDHVLDRLHQLAAAGVTDFSAAEFAPNPETRQRTRELFQRSIPILR